jgi:YHS domain-containing protein
METMKDLVCGAVIDRSKSASCYNLKGENYCFCSEECRDDFMQNPGSYI